MNIKKITLNLLAVACIAPVVCIAKNDTIIRSTGCITSSKEKVDTKKLSSVKNKPLLSALLKAIKIASFSTAGMWFGLEGLSRITKISDKCSCATTKEAQGTISAFGSKAVFPIVGVAGLLISTWIINKICQTKDNKKDNKEEKEENTLNPQFDFAPRVNTVIRGSCCS